MKIDKLTVDKIYDAAQIVDVVSDFVTLKKRGVNYVGLCPFHDDSSPSFYVSPSKNICKCFACGEGGTSVQFIMKHEQISYYEALRYLAQKYNIEVQERELSEEEKQLRSDRESMLVVNSWAQKFFTSQLHESEEGRNIGLSYFVERGFREDIIRKFQLGYAPGKRDALCRNALHHGFNEAFLLKTGLAYQRENGTVSDRFFGRAIFPIHTISGKVIAFGGRILGNKEKVAKYVNSPESEIYHKSYELYGIYFSKQAIVKADKCYLVEGYTDVLSMHQTGVENVVASSGTALTHGQIRLIRRFTTNITMLYDGDAAGIKAAVRGVDMLLEDGMNVRIVLLPEGEDPDSFARSHNSFDFMLYIHEHEVDFIRFKIELLQKEAGDDPMKKAQLIKDVMASIAVIPDPIVRSVYIKECCHLLGEREQVLIDEVIKIRSRRKSAAPVVETMRRSKAQPEEAVSTKDSQKLAENTPSANGTTQVTAQTQAGAEGGAETPASAEIAAYQADRISAGIAAGSTSVAGSTSAAGSTIIANTASAAGLVAPSSTGMASAADQASAASAASAAGSTIIANTASAADQVALSSTGTASGQAMQKSRPVYYPFKKYESALIRYVIRYGERVLFSTEGTALEEEGKTDVKVAEYIQFELENDNEEIDANIQYPLYRQILEEAVMQCREDERFVASHYFLSHQNLEISELAADMVSTKYQLSKYFRDDDGAALKQTSVTEEEQRIMDETRRLNKERDQLERWVVHDLFVLKNEHVKHEINAINKQIKAFQSDEEKVLGLMRQRMKLDNIKRLLSKELGDRIVTGIGT